jgi:flagellar protein FlaI
MATGHLGMCTIHAESVEAIINRLLSAPMNIPRALVAMTNIFIVMDRMEVNGKPARRAKDVTEMKGLNLQNNELGLEKIFLYDQKLDSFAYQGHSGLLEKNRQKAGLSEVDLQRELLARKTVLEWMVNQGIRKYKDVTNVIRDYYNNPTRVFQKARIEMKNQ